MNYEKTKKLVDNIVENEFQHVLEYKEMKFRESDKEYIRLTKAADEMIQNLVKDMPKEKQFQLDEYEVASAAEWLSICKFYFQQGLRAGLVNLEFMKDIKNIDFML